MKHAELVELGRKWLAKRCSVVITEVVTSFAEIPDVFGWDYHGRSTLIECKASRQDFRADDEKWVRRAVPEDELAAGIGCYRYYLVPENMIKSEEVRHGWGLLYATQKGRIRLVQGSFPFACDGRKELPFLLSLIRRGVVKTDATVKVYIEPRKVQATLTLESRHFEEET